MILHTQNRHQTKSNSASSDPSKVRKNSFHWRSDSGELDVFEAARYFSAANDHLNGVRDPNRHHLPRRSLDVTIMRSNPIPPDYHHQITDQKQPMKDESKKFKQPSSPGGRLASFLNSLFSQSSLKKKKKSSKSSAKDLEEESPCGRRKRRSSISHFRITSSAKNAAAAEIGSGFRTPPPYVITPTKSHARFADQHHQAVSVPMKGTSLKQSLEKLRVSEKMNLKKLSEEEEDGAESDSSSDLFDLPNHELDFFSSSLPVYETTHMESIRIGTPISSAT